MANNNELSLFEHTNLASENNQFTGGKPKYLAFGKNGEYWRDASVIGELPHEFRKPACTIASKVLGMKVQFGVKLMNSNLIKPSDVDLHERPDLIRLTGNDLPLSLIWND